MLACRSPLRLQQLPGVDWKPIDTVFSHYEEREGSDTFLSGNLLGIELTGAIDKKSGSVIPANQLDSQYASFVTAVAREWSQERMGGKLRKNAEGYLKADLGRAFPEDTVVAHVYLRENVASREVDSLLARASRMPEVEQVHFTSKEEAIKQFVGRLVRDDTAFLKFNPLPASVELLIRAGYKKDDALEHLKEELKSDNPQAISEIALPHIYPEQQWIRTQYLFFRYKT